jgi:hypothetical protein
MNLEENYLFCYISEGPAAANIYDKFTNSQLVVDWSFDALYFKFNNEEWITLSIGPETHTNDVYKINTTEMIRVFLKLCCYAVENIKGRNYKINKALNEIREIIK